MDVSKALISRNREEAGSADGREGPIPVPSVYMHYLASAFLQDAPLPSHQGGARWEEETARKGMEQGRRLDIEYICSSQQPRLLLGIENLFFEISKPNLFFFYCVYGY